MGVQRARVPRGLNDELEAKGLRWCSRCQQAVPIVDFRAGSQRGDWCRPCRAEVGRERRQDPEHRAKSAEWHRRGWLRRKYGITADEYDAMLEAQRGGCALCGGTNPHGNALAVDHDHETSRVRGLLCRSCNGALGWAEARGLGAIMAYLTPPM